MATTLLRTGVRSLLSKRLLEKKALPAICDALASSTLEPEAPRVCQQQPATNNFKILSAIRRMSSTAKRNVHQTRASTVQIEEESDADSDSDSDSETTEQSQFWRRKMRTLHSHLDINKDGVISHDDFMLMGERFANLGHLSPAEKVEFQKVLNEMWEEQWGDNSPYNLIGVEQYLEEMSHVLDDDSLKRKCHNFLPYLFKAVDRDRSGEISVEEFKIFFQCLGLHNDHAVVTFSNIDINEDGKISLTEFVELGRDFFLSNDHKRPSKHFWGPLVD